MRFWILLRLESFCLELRLSLLEIGKVNLKDSYASVRNGEAYIYNMHIGHYEQGNIQNKDPLRTRKLLLNKREINKLIRYGEAEGIFSYSYQFVF